MQEPHLMDTSVTSALKKYISIFLIPVMFCTLTASHLYQCRIIYALVPSSVSWFQGMGNPGAKTWETQRRHNIRQQVPSLNDSNGRTRKYPRSFPQPDNTDAAGSAVLHHHYYFADKSCFVFMVYADILEPTGM